MKNWENVRLVREFSDQGVDCYKLAGGDYVNEYYVVSEAETRKLMNTPEVVGYEVYHCLIPATSQMLYYFKEQKKVTTANILSILRGALNYPLEESCYREHIRVHDISFLSSERVFQKDEIAGLETRLQNYQAEIKEFEASVFEQKHKITESTSLIDRYKAQLDNVRNNREFDNLSKEIEFQGLEIEFSEKKIREFGEAVDAKKKDIAELTEKLEGRKADLVQKKSELEQIISETKQDEEKLREKAKKLEATIEPRLLTAFKRIRKGARNGLAVVYVQRGACGGCFNKIPPQKQLDIKLRKKIIVCEYCGRIMIDPELAGVEE